MSEKPIKYARAMAVYSTLLVALPAGVFGGLMLGSWLDEYFGTAPGLTVLGVLVGAVGAFHQMYRVITKAT